MTEVVAEEFEHRVEERLCLDRRQFLGPGRVILGGITHWWLPPPCWPRNRLPSQTLRTDVNWSMSTGLVT